MHFPEDPDKRKGLWDSFENSLLNMAPYYLVCEGVGDLLVKPSKIGTDEVKSIVDRFKKADVKRIGANHGMAIPPHYALFLEENGKTASLVEYISESLGKNGAIGSNEILRDIESLSVALFYDYSELESINVPLEILTENQSDFRVERISDGKCRVVRIGRKSE